MKSSPLISIIVPAYNAEACLPAAIESILNQSLADFELIIINDGSTDSTLSIAESIQYSDPRVNVISTENKGVSSARNSGIVISKGRYITFIDSDDLVDVDYLRRLYEDAESLHADIVVSLSCIGRKFSLSESKGIILNRRDALTNFMYGGGISNSPWAKLYKRDLIKDIRFDDSISIGEDMKYLYDCLSISNKVLFTKHKLYSYTPGEGGLTSSGLSDKIGHPLKAAEYIRGKSMAGMKRAADYKLFIEAYGVCRLTYSSSEYRYIYKRGLRAMRLTGIPVLLSPVSPFRSKAYSLGAYLFPRFMFSIIEIIDKKKGM